MELMIAVNKRRKCEVRELAKELNVFACTIMRDLQELSATRHPAVRGIWSAWRLVVPPPQVAANIKETVQRMAHAYGFS
nr:DeoR family transcriptional regulator [Paenibacillus xerothermodurans]